jgi:uncharacterized membrane protein YccC
MRRHLLASLELAAARPAISLGLRAATTTVPPLVLGELSGHPAFVWMALGGWLGTLADPGGPYPTRAKAMFSYLLWGTLATVVGTVAAQIPWLGVLVLTVGAAAGSAARAWGDAATTVGILCVITLCIAAGSPGDAALAAQRATLLAGGSCLAIALALGLWPVHPYAPVRAAVAECYRALATLADEIAGLPPEREEAWSAIAARDAPKVRAALERARAALAMVRRGRPADSARGEQLLVLFEIADLLLGEMAQLGESVAMAPSLNPAPLRDLAVTLRGIAQAIESRADAPPPPAISDPALAQRAHSIFSNAGIAALTAGALRTGSETPRAASPLPEPPARPPPIEALAPGSPIARHAARVAVTMAAGATLAIALHLSRPQWITVTIAIVLQPDLGGTLRRALQRLAGTVVGALVGAVLAPLVQRPIVFAALLFPLATLAIALRPLNYGLFSALVTPVFLLMAESLSGDWHLATVRVGNSLLGGALALAGGFLLWPTREAAHLPAQLSAALEALRAYLAALGAGGDEPSARRRFGLAAASADASLQRLLAEPGATERQIEAAMALLTYARRLRFTLGAVPRSAVAAIAEPLDQALKDLAEAVAALRPPAPLPPIDLRAGGEVAERVARQLEVLRSAARRFAQAVEARPPSGA